MEQPTRRENGAAWAGAALSTLGAADAGTLWWAHRRNLSLPCTGDGHGCDLVAASRWAHLSFGPVHDFPLALAGLLAYVITLTLCLAILGSETTRTRQRLRQVLWAVTLPGACYSWFLQYVAHFKIGAFCVWCFSSACVMTLLFGIATWSLTDSRRQEITSAGGRGNAPAAEKESVH
jgi:uncharacterized membrane protein